MLEFALRRSEFEFDCGEWLGRPGGDRRILLESGRRSVSRIRSRSRQHRSDRFSRGALACATLGFVMIESRPIWKGFHACQHYDGDGWQGATTESALLGQSVSVQIAFYDRQLRASFSPHR